MFVCCISQEIFVHAYITGYIRVSISKEIFVLHMKGVIRVFISRQRFVCEYVKGQRKYSCFYITVVSQEIFVYIHQRTHTRHDCGRHSCVYLSRNARETQQQQNQQLPRQLAYNLCVWTMCIHEIHRCLAIHSFDMHREQTERARAHGIVGSHLARSHVFETHIIKVLWSFWVIQVTCTQHYHTNALSDSAAKYAYGI